MRKIKSKTAAEWVQSEIDPDVRYLVRPLINKERTHMASLSGDESGNLFAGQSFYIAISFGLLDIEGIEGDNGMAFKLDFVNTKIGRRTDVRAVSEQSIDKLPPDIYDEIGTVILQKSGLSDSKSEPEKEELTEVDQADFTSDSSTASCPDAETAPETSPAFTEPVTAQ